MTSGAARPGGKVPIDPRIRTRRDQVRRDGSRRRRRHAAIGLAVVGALIAGVGLSRSSLLDVERIEVVGARHTSPEAVRSALGIDRGDAMIGIDGGHAAHMVEALPWVARAEVERNWPGTVRILVQEREPIATIELVKGRFALVDRTGRVLDVGSERPPALLALTDVPGRIAEGGRLPSETHAALDVIADAQEQMPGAFTTVSTGLDAILRSGATVRFGSADELDLKLVAVATVLDDVEVGCLATLDVRIPTSPALTRHQGCS